MQKNKILTLSSSRKMNLMKYKRPTSAPSTLKLSFSFYFLLARPKSNIEIRPWRNFVTKVQLKTAKEQFHYYIKYAICAPPLGPEVTRVEHRKMAKKSKESSSKRTKDRDVENELNKILKVSWFPLGGV